MAFLVLCRRHASCHLSCI